MELGNGGVTGMGENREHRINRTAVTAGPVKSGHRSVGVSA